MLEKRFNNCVYHSIHTIYDIIMSIGTLYHHFGGYWAASLKSIKGVIGDQQLLFEELTTVFYNIEACFNARPIASIDTSNLKAITPGYF